MGFPVFEFIQGLAEVALSRSYTRSLTHLGPSLNEGVVVEGFSLKYGNPWLQHAAETVSWNLS